MTEKAASSMALYAFALTDSMLLWELNNLTVASEKVTLSGKNLQSRRRQG